MIALFFVGFFDVLIAVILNMTVEEQDIFDTLKSKAEKFNIPFEIIEKIYHKEDIITHDASHAAIVREIETLIRSSIPKNPEDLDQFLKQGEDPQN